MQHFIGIHGWIVYSLVGLLLGLMAYRENLPMTMKSCFYPLMGDRIFGWMGDLIDVVSIMTTLFGVCTSLGLGTRQLNAGLHMINSDIPDDSTWIQVRYYNGLSASYLSIKYTTYYQHALRYEYEHNIIGRQYLVYYSNRHNIDCFWCRHGDTKVIRDMLYGWNVYNDRCLFHG